MFDFNSLKSKQEISQLNRLSDFISEEPSPLFDALLEKKKGLPNQAAEGRLTPSAQRPFFMCLTREKKKKRQEEITEQSQWKLLSCKLKKEKKARD